MELGGQGHHEVSNAGNTSWPSYGQQFENDQDRQAEITAPGNEPLVDTGDTTADGPQYDPDQPKTWPTYELARAAREAAKAFELPPDWREGRGRVTGFAIDEPYSADIDDMLPLPDDDSSRLVRVSIADVGAFLAGEETIARYAQRRAWTKYRNNRAVAPMIPRDISEDKLSLLDGAERPVITFHIPISQTGVVGLPVITRDIGTAKRITYSAVENLINGSDKHAAALHRLGKTAQLLVQARHGGTIDFSDLLAEDEEGNVLLNGQEYSIGQLIVRESMIAVNTALTLFVQENNIPVLYRNHVIPADLMPEIDNPLERSLILGPLARATYGTRPLGHVALNLPQGYVHGSSPLRRFPDFALHANLAAFLDEREEYPYPEERLERIAERLQVLALKEAAELAEDRRWQRTRSYETGVAPPYRKADYLLGAFVNGTAGPGDIATALFNAVGSDAEKAEVKAAAARFTAAHIHHARPAITTALARGQMSLRTLPGAPGNRQDIMLEDAAGNQYAYPRVTNPLKVSVAFTYLIGAICDTAVEPVIPYNRTREAQILGDGDNYLRKLASEGRIELRVQQSQDTDGSIYTGFIVTLNGERHTSGATRPSKTRSRREAAADIITRLDLINNPPPALPTPGQQIPQRIKDPASNPIILLDKRQKAVGGSEIDYSFFLTEDNQPGCTARLTDIDGQQYEATELAVGNKVAKQRAAARLLAQLPPQERRKKGQRGTR